MQVVSCDAKGFIKYWDAETFAFPTAAVSFKSLFATDLMACVKAGCFAKSIAVSKCGSRFAIACSDMTVRVFAYLTGKQLCCFHTSMEVCRCSSLVFACLRISPAISSAACTLAWRCAAARHSSYSEGT